MAKHLAAAREHALAHPRNDAEIQLRRAKINELWGTVTTDTLMFQAVNAHMQSLGFPPVCMATFRKDKAIVGQQYAEVFAEHLEVVASELFNNLEHLKVNQWGDYKKAQERDGNVAPLSDAVRKTILTQMQLTGVITQKHEHTGNMTFEMGVKEVLAVNPEGERKVIPLLKDEGHGELLPPTKADG